MKLGYKQTEVGVIPNDWEVAPLGSFVTFQRGFDLPNRLRKPGSVPVVSSAGITDFHDTAMISPPGVVTGRYGTIGEIFYLEEPYWPLNTTLYIRNFHDNDPKFVFHFLQKFDFHTFSGKSGVPGVNRNDLHAEKVGIPKLRAEQSAIATTLDDVDTLLVGLDKIIAKKRDLKQAAMQQLLTGKTRLPGFAGEWEVKRLDALASIRSGGTPSTGIAKFWDGGVPWCTPTDITQLDGSKYLWGTSRTISQEGLNNSSAEMIPASSVVMTSRATIGECAINSVPVTTNQGFKNFVPFDTTDVEFLYYLLQTQKQGFIRLCAGSTFLEIGKTQLSAYEVRLPATKNEQAAIAEVLSDMDAELATLEQRREKTRLLKQGMMQELLTGRTRLVQPVAQPASNVVPFKKSEVKPVERKANVHFQRSVFAAEIVERLHAEPTFGHVKFQKLIYLAEHMCNVDIDAHYHRDAAGPYDNRALRSIDSQMEKSKWFKAQKVDKRYQYVPLEKRGDHKQYFDRYFADSISAFDKVIDTFKSAKSEQCEIVATLYEAWRDLLAKDADASDDSIVDQVLNHWHDNKRKIEEERWRKALDWMRAMGFVPQGCQ